MAWGRVPKKKIRNHTAPEEGGGHYTFKGSRGSKSSENTNEREKNGTTSGGEGGKKIIKRQGPGKTNGGRRRQSFPLGGKESSKQGKKAKPRNRSLGRENGEKSRMGVSDIMWKTAGRATAARGKKE